MQDAIPKAFEQERIKIESILGSREKVYADLLGKIQKKLPKEIRATA